MGLYKTQSIFDPADLTDSDNIGAYVRAGSDGDLVSSTNVGGKEGLDVNIINAALTVSATDFDIRDLDAAQDNVAISDGTDTLEINADGSINVNVALTAGQYAEDSAHADADLGNFMLAVRHDANTTMVDTDGDYSALLTNAVGSLKTALVGSTGNDLVVNADGSLNVNADIDVVNGFEKAEDSAHTSGDIGAFTLGVAQATLAASVSADGDYGAFKLTSRGALWTTPVGTVADDAADTENPIKMGQRAVSGALTAVSASNDRADLLSDLYRRTWVNTSPNIGLAQGNVTVGTSEIALPTTAQAGRRKLVVQNTSNNDIFVGPTGLSTTTGLRVSKGATLELEAGPNLAFFAIASGAGNVVRVTELA